MVRKRETELVSRKSKSLGLLIDHLRYLPESLALDIFYRLRATSDPSIILGAIEDEMLDMQTSTPTIVSAAGRLPQVHSGIEFELAIRHPIPYPPISPGEPGTFLGSRILALVRENQANGENTQALGSQTGRSLQKALKPLDPGHMTVPEEDTGERGKRPQDQHTDNLKKKTLLASSHYYDSRLDHLDISFWTPVSVTDQFAARVISLYLETDHPVIGLFHSGWFIHSLVTKRTQYCSGFFVNAFLAFACVRKPNIRMCQSANIFDAASLYGQGCGRNEPQQ